jgi:hypothetical protein
MYALAASAAGVGVLALAQPAEAKIVYTPTHVVIGYGGVQSYQLDLNHDKVTDFTLSHTGSCSTTGCSYILRQWPDNENAAVGHFSVWQFFDSALKWGARIGPKANFLAHYAWLVRARTTFSKGRTWVTGPWANVRNRYLGLRFQIKGKIHYGWARMTVKVNGADITATLTGYAYETIPNKAIIAGKTKGPDGTPATLGRLALGRK